MSPVSEANDDVRAIYALLEALREDKRRLDDDIKQMEDRLGDALGHGPVLLDGKTLRRHKRRPRTRNWMSDDLLRRVLDARMVDPETGETETQVERLVAVYGCRGYQAKVRELERRGIQPDEWCEIEDVPGWNIEVR